MPRRVAVRILSILAAVAAIIGVGFTPAYADTGPGGFTILHAAVGAHIHNCTVIGTDQYDNQAIVCADIFLPETSTYPYIIDAMAEAYCQNASGVVIQCANITEAVSIEDNGRPLTVSGTCGHAAGACPAARFIRQTNPFSMASSDGCPNPSYNVWSVVWGADAPAGEPPTAIELPQSDKSIPLGVGTGANDDDNYSNGHFYDCF